MKTRCKDKTGSWIYEGDILHVTDYGWYGDKLFKAIDDKYGWELADELYDDEFFEEW